MKEIFDLDNPDRCTFKYCSHVKYIGNDKCIFHCEKDDWYSIQNEEKKWDDDKVSEFWSEIRELIKENQHYEFQDIIFPKFENKKINLRREGKNTLASGYNFFDQGVSIYDLNFKSTMNFTNCLFLDNVEFRYIGFKELYFTKCEFLRDISLSDSRFADVLKFKMCHFKQRVFMCRTVIEHEKVKFIFNDSYFYDRFVLRNIKSDSLKLYFKVVHFYENSIADITNVKLKSFHIKEFYNYSKTFKIVNTEIVDKLMISNSNFDNVSMNNCDLSATRKLFKNVSFINFRLDNIKWGELDPSHFIANRDTIRQLKNINDQQGNYIQANKFYALEMEKYSEEIKSSKNYLEKIVFLISKELSNYSQDWTLPVFWYFFITSLFVDVFLLKSFNTYSILPSIIAIIYSLKVLMAYRLLRSENSSIRHFWAFIAFNYGFYIAINSAGMIGLNGIFWFFNPLGIKTIEADLLINVLFVIHKLVSVFIGYHLVTALRFHTRRK